MDLGGGPGPVDRNNSLHSNSDVLLVVPGANDGGGGQLLNPRRQQSMGAGEGSFLSRMRSNLGPSPTPRTPGTPLMVTLAQEAGELV